MSIQSPVESPVADDFSWVADWANQVVNNPVGASSPDPWATAQTGPNEEPGGVTAKAQLLLDQLPQTLARVPGQAGFAVTRDKTAAAALTDFLKLIPGAEPWLAQVRSGRVSAAGYAAIEKQLQEQAGIVVAPTEAEIQALAKSARSILDDQNNVLVPNPTPAQEGYRFLFDGPQGPAWKSWLERSRGGCVIDGDDGAHEVDAVLFDHALSGGVLTPEEYASVCQAVWGEMMRDRGDQDSEISQRLGKEVLSGDEATGYLWEKDDQVYWTGPDGVETCLDFPGSGKPEEAAEVAGFTRRGTSEEFYGAFSVPAEKRDAVVSFVDRLDHFEGKQALLDAIRAGSLSDEQYIDLTTRLDWAANNGTPTTQFDSGQDLLDALTPL